jgi:hypothetical protein
VKDAQRKSHKQRHKVRRSESNYVRSTHLPVISIGSVIITFRVFAFPREFRDERQVRERLRRRLPRERGLPRFLGFKLK